MSRVLVGDTLPQLRIPPIPREALRLYADASGDINPIHVDRAVARAAGLDDVVAHGMMNMASLGRLLTDWRPQANLRRFGVRFQGIVHAHDAIVCEGRVVAIAHENGRDIATLELTATNQRGVVVLSGDAIVVL